MTEQYQNKQVEKIIKKLNKAEPLITEDLQLLRDQVPVVDSLTIKSHPSAKENKNLQKIKTKTDEFKQFQELTKPHIRYEHKKTAEQSVALLDKMYPHGLFEIMLIQSGNTVMPSIFDLDENLQCFSFNVIKKFSDYVKEREMCPYIAWNYDPKTKDRESGQGVKRFHLHLIGRTNEEIDFITNNQKQLKDLEPIRARRLVDETSIIGSYVLFDILKKEKLDTMELFEPFSSKLPKAPNLMLKLKNNWQTICEKKFKVDFEKIHTNLLKSYEDIMNCIWEGQSGNWVRPNIKNENVIFDLLNKLPYLNDKTKESIIHIIKKIQPSLLKKTNILSQEIFRNITTHIYPTDGPCYSTSICEVENNIYCTIRPYMFSDLGGAGICNLHGIITKIKKGVSVMNKEEIKKRFDFQKQFIKHL